MIKFFRTFYLVFIYISLFTAFSFAAENTSTSESVPFAPGKALHEQVKPSNRTLMVVETDDQSAKDSLNRVSGEIDLGFGPIKDKSSDDSSSSASPFGITL